MLRKIIALLASIGIIVLGVIAFSLLSQSEAPILYLRIIGSVFVCMGIAGLCISIKAMSDSRTNALSQSQPGKMDGSSKIFFILILLALLWGVFGVLNAMNQ